MFSPSSPQPGSTPTSSYADVTSGATAEEVNAAYEEALDDVHTRFILNLPEEELSTSDRIFFQLEQAWWFYDDFWCDGSKHALPRFKNVRSFAVKMFEYSPLLEPIKGEFDRMWGEFSAYKRKISTYGAILLDNSCKKIVLCQVWNGQSWTMPAGKINQNERGIDAAARETYEETGFDPNCLLGLTKQMQEEGKPLSWKPLQDQDSLVFMDAGKRRTCFVCKGVPEDFPFEPVARKEVSAVEWHELDNLPKKSFAVLPFMKQLRRWIKQNTRSGTPGKKKKGGDTPGRNRSGSRSGSSKKQRMRNNSRGKVREDDSLTETGLASAGESDGWTEEDMFKVNEQLSGRKITYDGNPHQFAEKGFDGGLDPHAFHVVGGSFMNSGITKLAPAPTESKLQPLFRRDDAPADVQESSFQPFFSQGGETPWGDVVADALKEEAAEKNKVKKGKKIKQKQVQPADAKAAGAALLSVLQGSSAEDPAELDVFMTDKAITAQSQKEKSQTPDKTKKRNKGSRRRGERGKTQQWVENLPQSQPTEHFGDFRFDVDKIMEAMKL